MPQNRCLRKILVLVKSTNGGGSLWTKTYDGPGQPCKAGWEPPALGRWYCQAPTGWLELRPVRRPHPSHYSLHYFTTPLERPSPLVARRRHRPPLCSNVCTQTMSLQQILFYQLLIVLQISVSSAAIQFEVLSPEGRESPLEIITPNISLIYMP